MKAFFLSLFGLIALSGCLATPRYIGTYSFPARPDPSKKVVETLAASLGAKVEWVDDHDYGRQAIIEPAEKKQKEGVPVVVYTYRPGEATVVVQTSGSDETDAVRAVRRAVEEALATAGIVDWKFGLSTWSFAK